VDATDDEDPTVVRAMTEFKVVGLPTVILYDSQGQEAARFNDFVKAEPFLEALQTIN
jgi:thiol:disulfide interchange protein